jgi:hypothetical protein
MRSRFTATLLRGMTSVSKNQPVCTPKRRTIQVPIAARAMKTKVIRTLPEDPRVLPFEIETYAAHD